MKLVAFLLTFLICQITSTPLLQFDERPISNIRPFIANGMRAPTAPYYAYILFLNAQNQGNFGGGSLISARHVLTAAVNIQGFQTWDVRLGGNDRLAMISVRSTTATAHPQYNQQTRANDIGVIRFQNAISISGLMFPIALPEQGLFLPMTNDQGRVAGFGITNVNENQPTRFLNQGFKRTISFTRCQMFFIAANETHFCAEDVDERSNFCDGDQGGGFVMSYRRQDVLVGIASLSARPCGQHTPSAYTRVSNYLAWIQQQLNL